jgi:hypothetical protein
MFWKCRPLGLAGQVESLDFARAAFSIDFSIRLKLNSKAVYVLVAKGHGVAASIQLLIGDMIVDFMGPTYNLDSALVYITRLL